MYCQKVYFFNYKALINISAVCTTATSQWVKLKIISALPNLRNTSILVCPI